MAVRARTALVFAAIAFVGGYGALVATNRIHGFWEEPPELTLDIENLDALLRIREGSRQDNWRQQDLPEQAPLANIELYPEDEKWWRDRCRGFFTALLRANLDVTQRLLKEDDAPFFPEVEEVPTDMLIFNSANEEAAMDHLARYERTFPLDPAEIRSHPVFVTDLPVCLRVATGDFPKRGG